jgi:hypothetical protein
MMGARRLGGSLQDKTSDQLMIRSSAAVNVLATPAP